MSQEQLSVRADPRGFSTKCFQGIARALILEDLDQIARIGSSDWLSRVSATPPISGGTRSREEWRALAPSRQTIRARCERRSRDGQDQRRLKSLAL